MHGQIFNLVFSCIFNPITRNRSNRYDELAQELPATYQPLKDRGIPLSALSDGTASNNRFGAMQFCFTHYGSPPDINECPLTNLQTCPPNSKCKNTPTGCECLDGFMKNRSKCKGELNVLCA